MLQNFAKQSKKNGPDRDKNFSTKQRKRKRMMTKLNIYLETNLNLDQAHFEQKKIKPETKKKKTRY